MVSVCFSKGLGAPVGSAVVSSREMIKKARRIRKMFGGGMRQVGIIAAGALYALENNFNRISEDHRRAGMLTELIAKAGILEIRPDDIQTNIVVINLPDSINPPDFIRMLAEKGVLVVPFGAKRIRAVAHLNIDDEEIRHAAEVISNTAKSII